MGNRRSNLGPPGGLGRVARAIARKTILGALPSAFEGGAFDFALFVSITHTPKPFSCPNSRSTLIFDRSLQST